MKIKIKNLLQNKTILALIMAIFTYVTLCKEDSLLPYNVHSWLIFILLIIFFNMSLKKEISSKINKHTLIWSLVFSLILVSGRIINAFMYAYDMSFWKEFLTLKSVIFLIGNFNLLYIILKNIIPKLCELDYHKLLTKDNKIKPSLIFIGSFIIIILGWLPYFLSYFPGTISPDSLREISFVLNDFKNLSDHHTVAHILFIAGPIKLGLKLFGNINYGIALATIFQMIIMALIFSYLIKFLYSRNIKKWILGLILAYFTFVPMHAYYSIVMWKDVLFAGCLLLLTVQTIKLIEKKDIKLENCIPFIITSIFTIFFRNNAIYMYFIYTIFAFILLRKHYKRLILIFLIIFGFYFSVKGPVFNYLHISKSASSEYIGIPLQQVGRMAVKNVEFTEDEQKLLNKLMPIKDMKKEYKPISSDGIKFSKKYNMEVFNENKMEYLKLWLKLVLKHPAIATEAYFTSTLGYYYPGVQYWTIAYEVYENDLGIYTSPKISPYIQNLTRKLEDRNLPIVTITWSIGLCFWIIAIFTYLSVYRKNKKSLLVYIPVWGIWLTMLIATPVYAEFRYVYGAFVSLPLLILFPFLNSKEAKNEK